MWLACRNGRSAGFAAGGRVAWLVAVALALAGCASIDAAAGRATAAVEPAARADARPSSPERKRLIEAFGGEYSAPAAERYLDDVLTRLANASDAPTEPYRVTLLNSPIVNAFALPSGDIFITRGLLALANDGAGGRGRDGARDRPCHRPSRRPARRTRADARRCSSASPPRCSTSRSRARRRRRA